MKTSRESDLSDHESDHSDVSDVQRAPKKQRHALSAEEVQVARETAQLFKSNIFKMQIDELLSEINISEKRFKLVDKCLFEINDLIASVKDSKQYSIKDAKKQFASAFPAPRPSNDAHYSLQYLAPASVNVMGSYALKTVVKQPEGLSVDLVVEMPASLFDSKDNVNFRYFHKRSFYIHYLKEKLQSKLSKASFSLASIDMSSLNGDQLLPIIRIAIDKPSKLFVNVIPSCPAIDTRRLSPDNNSVRFDSELATPLYNSVMLIDASYTANHKFLAQAAQSCPAFREACKLGRLWLRQRGFGSSYTQGGFGHVQWSLLMAALLNDKSHILMNGYSSYQLFKGTLGYIASTGINVGFSPSGKAVSSLSPFDQFPAKLVDTDIGLNVAHNMSQWSLDMLRHEAAIACEMLLDVVKDRFASIFLTKLEPSLRFDAVYSVKVHDAQAHPSAVSTAVSELESSIVAQDVLAGGRSRFVSEKLYRVVSRALDSRVAQIWLTPVEQSTTRNSDTREIKVSLLLKSSASEVLTRGPQAEDEKAASQFRRFWGPKAELRRFADGSIVESVVWDPAPQASDLVVRQVLSYICPLHLPGSKVSAVPSGMSSTLLESIFIEKDDFFAKYNALEAIGRDISKIDLPIAVKGVHALSPSLRMTSTDKPEPYDIHGNDAVAEGIIEFETSFRWPADTDAVEQTKVAFLVKIAESLPKLDESYTARVGTETVVGTLRAFILVRGRDGFCFKLRIRTERDMPLLEHERTLASPNDKSVIDQKILAYDRQLSETAVAHNRMVRSIALRYPAYGPACRLFKYWLKSHLLYASTLVSDQVAELVSLVPFLDSTPYTVPQTATTAFGRIIKFVASWNWKLEPLIIDPSVEASTLNELTNSTHSVDITGTSSSQKLHRIATDAFTKLRASDPMLTLAPLFIATPADLSGILWTRSMSRSAAGSLVCSRMTALGLASRASLESMFVSSLTDYDFVIPIENPSAQPRKQVVYKNLQSTSHMSASQIALRSQNYGLMLFQQLAEDYRDSLILFYRGDNTHNEGVIAGVWLKNVAEPRQFRVNLSISTEPVGDGTVKLNKPAILQELKRRGGDLIKDIQTNR